MSEKSKESIDPIIEAKKEEFNSEIEKLKE